MSWRWPGEADDLDPDSIAHWRGKYKCKSCKQYQQFISTVKLSVSNLALCFVAEDLGESLPILSLSLGRKTERQEVLVHTLDS